MSVVVQLLEDTVRSLAKTSIGAGVVVLLGLSGIGSSPAAQVVLSDPMTSWPLNFGVQGENIMLKDGAIHIIESANASHWATYPGFDFTDMDASVTITARTATGNAAGLIFWSTGQSDFFMVSVSDANGNFSVIRRMSANGGSWQTILPFTVSPAIKTGAGAVNTIRIVTKGNSLALFINGQSIGTLALQAPAGGGTVGIEGEGVAGQPADYVFSNLSVSQ
jgi:hypothetical protein